VCGVGAAVAPSRRRRAAASGRAREDADVGGADVDGVVPRARARVAAAIAEACVVVAIVASRSALFLGRLSSKRSSLSRAALRATITFIGQLKWDAIKC